MALAETLLLNGQLSINPSTASMCADGVDLGTLVTLSESMSISAKLTAAFTLSADPAFPVDLTTVPSVNALYIEADSKVKLTITTADGALQVVPVDPMMVWFSATVPITALSITRLAGTTTNVKLILGQKA
jgi:hypothetical protein